MTNTISFPEAVKNELLSIADKSGYVQVVEILRRGSSDELVFNSNEEAQAVVNVARIKLLDAQLKNPYWDDSEEEYNEDHEENFQEVQMGVFEKTVSYISQAFKIESKV